MYPSTIEVSPQVATRYNRYNKLKSIEDVYKDQIPLLQATANDIEEALSGQITYSYLKNIVYAEVHVKTLEKFLEEAEGALDKDIFKETEDNITAYISLASESDIPVIEDFLAKNWGVVGVSEIVYEEVEDFSSKSTKAVCRITAVINAHHKDVRWQESGRSEYLPNIFTFKVYGTPTLSE